MARPTTEKICIMCGKPFLPTGGRQKRCPDCKGGKPKAGRNTLTAAAKAAAELGISYGKYVAMSEEERARAREEKTMAEQEKQTTGAAGYAPGVHPLSESAGNGADRPSGTYPHRTGRGCGV